ncbi:TIGR03087 family PEP-CTERM/XrtA system glycosyltransferase [Zooshikella harenae]|uniref:TIGR03087 family PEP-CTERM/XrtA system glycosyltransferase n=1 Tax=Zooshikella harenae TaxID=2827238 RepID=A0ABS5Z778_9GAMM|nr:TIGR03087 family PEP-CTERM/XrtA system glycosyltransferase [Zooshikella harenae]MBU2709911.1 TIGR03087 family PEP-CTERM/XrtA system glycosyltransferase [Zooshikella harenae]
MKNLLYLVHRIPFPPNKGDKIRSYHLLRFLAEHYNVYLGTFIDDPNDKQYIDTVKQWCTELNVEILNPSLAKLKSLMGIAKGQPLTLPYYTNASMHQWVSRVTQAHEFAGCVIFSSSMAQYFEGHFQALPTVVDFVDVDSDKWRQYSQSKSGVMGWVYRREANYLEKYECSVANQVNASVFVSDKEASLFKTLAPNAANVVGIPNGVDFDFFDPSLTMPSPYGRNGPVIAFTGAMDYWANVDAVRWFSDEVFPHCRAAQPDVQFYIVGGNPTQEVQELAKQEGITVTGRVEDIRPYILHANVIVAPLRIARGIQNKVLEAMALGKWVIATEQAMEGIDAPAELATTTPLDPNLFYEAIQARLAMSAMAPADGIRQWIQQNFSWQTSLMRFQTLLSGSP